MKKRILSGIMCMVVAAGLAGCGGSGDSASGDSSASSSSAAPINLKMSVTTSETSVWMEAANVYKEEIEANTDGRYTVTVYPNEQLSAGDQIKGIEMLFTGTTDLDIHSTMMVSSLVPELSVISMPWLFPNGYDSADEFIFDEGSTGGQFIKDAISAKGAQVVGFGENGFRQITNNVRPITSAEDLKMLKIRIPGISLLVDVFQELGADPTQMSFAEVFTALQQGAIDGQENPYDTIRSAKIQEVQKYMTIWNYSYDPLTICVSNKIWESLSDEDKEIFSAAGIKAGAAQVAASRAMDAEIIAEFEGIGVEVNELSPEAIEELKVIMEPLYDKYRDEYGEDAFAAFGYTF
ncbi:MAG: DctP family TRAP transporter solute-binding subunit [Bacillota bacterium]